MNNKIRHPQKGSWTGIDHNVRTVPIHSTRRRTTKDLEFRIRAQAMGLLCGFGRYSDICFRINSDHTFWCIKCRDAGAGKTKNDHVCVGDDVKGAWIHLKMHAKLGHKIPKKIWDTFEKIIKEDE